MLKRSSVSVAEKEGKFPEPNIFGISTLHREREWAYNLSQYQQQN